MKKKTGYTLTEIMIIVATIGMVAALVIPMMGGCKQNAARSWGGSYTIQLDRGLKLETCTWKETHLWLLTTKRSETEEPKTHKFTEKSALGILQGEVIIEEK